MTQLILDAGGVNLTLPEVRGGDYVCKLKPLSKDLEMASGRMVRELRGSVWQITYKQTVFSELNKDAFLEACAAGMVRPITCMFLSPGSGELQSSTFFVSDYQLPKYQWSRPTAAGDKPVWSDYSVSLREVTPHD